MEVGGSSVMTLEADQRQTAGESPAIDDGFEYDVCVIGTGRVGLPLGLSFLGAGMRSVGIDVDSALIGQVNAGVMPFQEPGYDELVGRRQFQIFDDPAIVSKSAALVITVGTPLHNHIETDLSQIERVLNEVTPYLREGQLICLRSTVAPGTTQFVRRWLERYTSLTVGVDLFLAFCPERIAEGKSFTELHTLPQIIGSEDPASERRAAKLFGRLTEEVLATDYVTAELVKLFNNILRYVHFAMANEFAMIADEFGANIYEAQRLANYKYPRSFLAPPGLTAGTCLRKDFGMINERSPYPDMLLSAWKSNEFMPAFLVEKLLKRTDIHGKIVAILGFTFKADTDDLRDSLAPKLWRYIHRQLPAEIRVSEHHVEDPIPEPSVGSPRNWPLEEVLEGIDVVFVATNHSEYRSCLIELGKRSPTAWIADIWNVGGIDRIFYQAGQLHASGT
jgi:UDP-N-acetyl-D-mannosaminuronic acid dehydrogenase